MLERLIRFAVKKPVASPCEELPEDIEKRVQELAERRFRGFQAKVNVKFDAMRNELEAARKRIAQLEREVLS